PGLPPRHHRGDKRTTDKNGVTTIEVPEGEVADSIPEGSRTPFDPDDPKNWEITADSLRAKLAARKWEEFRQQLFKFQRDGNTVPPEIVRSLLDMLAKEDLVKDATDALG